MHVGSVAIFTPPAGGFDYDALVALIGQRIGLVPRFRQKVKGVPGHLANPVWVDDPDFAVTYHVRRSALPKPGTMAQLQDLVGRLQSRVLDRTRPLWEIYFVEGLQGGEVALVTKTHHAMVDGISAIDIGTVILDLEPVPRVVPEDDWRPRREPGPVGQPAGGVTDMAWRRSVALDSARMAVGDVGATPSMAV